MGKNPAYIGVDIGGTKILIGVVDDAGTMLFKNQILTKPEREWQQIVDSIRNEIKMLGELEQIDGYSLKGIGVGCPGTVSGDRTHILLAPNLNWKDVPVQIALSEKTNLPVYLENDCNLQTLGVAAFGEARAARTVLGIFIGTGIGGGIVHDNDLYTGFNGTAAEVGHVVVCVNGKKCGCGNSGCLEAYASTKSLYQEVKRIKRRKLGPAIENDPFFRMENTTQALREHYLNEDSIVRNVINNGAHLLGIGVANFINLINPEMIVFGGGLIEALGDSILPNIIETAFLHSMPGATEGLTITKTGLKEDAGVYGGAALVRIRLKQ